MKISINILTWNNKDTIVKALTAVYNDVKEMDCEFILVDNGSTDGTCELIKSWIATYLFHSHNFICNKENQGISAGKNKSISLSRGEYILMLDGDVVPVTNSIKLMLEWLETNNENAIGMYPNKFVTSPDMAESECLNLDNIKEHNCACLFYGLYRRSIFDNGLKMCEEGEMSGPGYGWEDHDFYMRLKAQGVKQYATDINSSHGRYFHAINSSIRAMGREKYIESSRARAKQFHEVWDAIR